MRHCSSWALATLWALLALASCSSTSGGVDAAVDAALDVDVGLDARTDQKADQPRPDVFVPFALALTVDELPAAMNGSQPFTALDDQSQTFRLALPPSGFTIDVTWQGSQAVASSLKITADVDLGQGAQRIAAGSNLLSHFAVENGRASWKLPASYAAPVGPLTLHVALDEGATTRDATLAVDIADKTFLRDPFRLEDTWVLIFSQDNYTISTNVDAQGNWLIDTQPQPNGIPDFVEDLRIAGFGSPNMLPAAAALKARGVQGTNEILRVWLEELVLQGTRTAYLLAADGTRTEDSPGLRIFKEGEVGAPTPASYQAQVLQGGETSKAFSMISIGGGDPARRLLGLSERVDLNNRHSEANIGPQYGVFPTTALHTAAAAMVSDPSVKQLLTFMLGEFAPELGAGGKRVGESPLDAEILADGFDPAKASVAARNRHGKLLFLANLLGRLLGALTAHEMGHALGLVAAGAPPYGLFGGEKKASFTGDARTTLGHIDTPGFNIMEAGPGSAPGVPIDFAQYLGTPRFNELNRAYLQGRLLVLERPTTP